MTQNGIAYAALVVGVLAGVLGCRGATRTQAALRSIDQRDRIIDIQAWVDRKVFRAG